MKNVIAVALLLLLAARASLAVTFTVPVSPDGHYHMRGAINGVPANFLVDTGATYVSVGADLARRANLSGGASVQLTTADGVTTARIVIGVGVNVGPLYVPDTTVAINTSGLGDEVLLGQSFLRRFLILMDGSQMILQEKQPEAGDSSPSRIALPLPNSSAAPPVPEFRTSEARLAYLQWLGEMSERLKTRLPDWPTRKEFLQAVWYESRRAGLNVSLVLGLIETSSTFRKFAVSDAGSRGYLLVPPEWTSTIGDGDVVKLFHMQTNLRYGLVMLRHYLDQTNGNVNSALSLYLAQSRRLRPGSPEMRRAIDGVFAAQRHWTYDDPATASR
jgi:clan AA aspartic protease (TIGR02281 family)